MDPILPYIEAPPIIGSTRRGRPVKQWLEDVHWRNDIEWVRFPGTYFQSQVYAYRKEWDGRLQLQTEVTDPEVKTTNHKVHLWVRRDPARVDAEQALAEAKYAATQL